MTLKASTATSNGVAAGTGLTEQFEGGLLFLFSGPVPATADEALNLTEDHTEVVVISNASSGTGLSFDAPSGGVLGKDPTQTWSGVVGFTGVDSGESTLAPTFYRFCADGDNGQGAANTTTGYRLQGTVGGPNSGAELQLGVAELTPGNTQPVGSFGWRVGSL